MIREFKGKKPLISKNAIVDETALLIGNIIVEEHASIWPGVILRADEEEIVVKRNACVLDKAFVEAPKKVIIGEGSIISHGAIIHGSEIGENVLVGIGAIVLEVRVGKNSIIAAGAVVTKDVEERSFMAGVPARKVRNAEDSEIKRIKEIASQLWNKAKWLR